MFSGRDQNTCVFRVLSEEVKTESLLMEDLCPVSMHMKKRVLYCTKECPSAAPLRAEIGRLTRRLEKLERMMTLAGVRNDDDEEEGHLVSALGAAMLFPPRQLLKS